jgi:hypothetical protein
MNGYGTSLVPVICEIGVGLRPSEMRLNIAIGCPVLSEIELGKVKRALSSVQSLRILGDDTAKYMTFQMKKLLQCLPRLAILRISSHQFDSTIVHLVDHPPRLIQLEYKLRRGGFVDVLPAVPPWCRSGGRFDSLSLEGCAVGEIASFCKKLALRGTPTLRNFLSSLSSLDIEELHCDGEVDERDTLYHPKIGGMDKLSKLTCSFSFALALLKRRRLPMLQELVFIVPTDSHSVYTSNRTSENCLGPITDLLLESSNERAPMRVLSIPIWTPWESLFKVAEILSQGNDSGANPTVFLPSFPHSCLLLPLVDCLNGERATQKPKFPIYLSEEYCRYKGVCYQCHNGDWTCADIERCRRGRRGELVAITRYTLSS